MELKQDLEIARIELLEPSEISDGDVDRLLGQIMSHDVDLGEMFFQSRRSETWSLSDGIVKAGSFGQDRGVGIRAVSGEKTGFAYCDEIELPALARATRVARSIARHGGDRSVAMRKPNYPPARYSDADPIVTATESEKVELLQRLDRFARSLDQSVREVSIALEASHETNLIVSSDSSQVGDIRPLVRFDISVISERDGRRETGRAGGGGRFDLRWLFESDIGERLAREAVRVALLNLEAVDAPAGAMPVVLGPGWPGVLLHEAVGHGLEGDFNRKGTSNFSGRVGDQVASPLCTVVDDGTLRDRRGSLTVDDEGTPTDRTVLIENGILKGYMQDKQNARLMNVPATGNGRRQSYAFMPMPRMTNTFMVAGDSDPEEVISSVDKGVYAVGFGGGQVDITSGKFVFSATEAYLIENGRTGHPIRGATLIGNGPEIMSRISMVGNDLRLDEGVGTCGKNGQTVPVGVGQPTLKIDELTVGGTSA